MSSICKHSKLGANSTETLYTQYAFKQVHVYKYYYNGIHLSTYTCMHSTVHIFIYSCMCACLYNSTKSYYPCVYVACRHHLLSLSTFIPGSSNPCPTSPSIGSSTYTPGASQGSLPANNRFLNDITASPVTGKKNNKRKSVIVVSN